MHRIWIAAKSSVSGAKRFAPLFALVGGLCGAMPVCSAGNATPRSQSSTLATTAHSASAALPQARAFSSSLSWALNKDMAYTDAHKTLLAQGWTPEKDLRCKAHVGANEALCKATPDLKVCRICDEIPELSAYSDEGDAAVHFTHARQRLTINASGSISDWKVARQRFALERLGLASDQVTRERKTGYRNHRPFCGMHTENEHEQSIRRPV